MKMVDWTLNKITIPPHDPWTNCANFEATLSGTLSNEGRIVYSIDLDAVAKELNESLREYMKPNIKRVIFNPPATIIIWNDDTKSVVKCQNGESYDAEKGFALAYLKKLLGNDNTFNKEIHKWVKEVEPKKPKLNLNEMTAAIKNYCITHTCNECKLYTDIPCYEFCHSGNADIERNYNILFGEK